MPSYNYKNTIEDIAKEYNVAFFAYFGSYQTEYYHKESDIDIAFLPEKNMTIETKVSLMDDLIKYHRKSEIDLLDLRKAEPVLRYEKKKNIPYCLLKKIIAIDLIWRGKRQDRPQKY